MEFKIATVLWGHRSRDWNMFQRMWYVLVNVTVRWKYIYSSHRYKASEPPFFWIMVLVFFCCVHKLRVETFISPQGSYWGCLQFVANDWEGSEHYWHDLACELVPPHAELLLTLFLFANFWYDRTWSHNLSQDSALLCISATGNYHFNVWILFYFAEFHLRTRLQLQ